jgi:hypothetical protein
MLCQDMAGQGSGAWTWATADQRDEASTRVPREPGIAPPVIWGSYSGCIGATLIDADHSSCPAALLPCYHPEPIIRKHGGVAGCASQLPAGNTSGKYRRSACMPAIHPSGFRGFPILARALPLLPLIFRGQTDESHAICPFGRAAKTPCWASALLCTRLD